MFYRGRSAALVMYAVGSPTRKYSLTRFQPCSLPARANHRDGVPPVGFLGDFCKLAVP